MNSITIPFPTGETWSAFLAITVGAWTILQEWRHLKNHGTTFPKKKE